MPFDAQAATRQSAWFVYILRCADNSLYTGITTDVSKRINQHNGADNQGAKYTHGRRPVALVYQESSSTRSVASKREYEIKSLKKQQKEQLIKCCNKKLEKQVLY